MGQPIAVKGGQLDELHHQASQIRQAIEATNLRDSGYTLSDFPKSSCHHAVKLLAFHLAELGWSGLKRVEGIRDDPRFPHYWLLAGEVIIDITADQYSDGQSSVIVTTRSPWHETWKSKVEPFDQEFLANWRMEKRPDYDVYRKIMATLASEVLP